jgi:predicted SprT family Zn-dependent metalloprotease
MSPTAELYNAMQIAFDHFNNDLFIGKLPQVLFTNQRQQGVMGYFAPNRWTSTKGKNCHEIAINPLYVGKATLIELMQTLVHEMVHCWQFCHGKPGRTSYHNKEWSNKMISIGLMPSSTGKPGGDLVGQHMADYPAPKGKFIKSCEKLLKEKSFTLPWVDRFAHQAGIQSDNEKLETIMEALSDIDSALVNQLTTRLEDFFEPGSFAPQAANAVKKVKVKYTCPECKINVWGRANLQLRCDNCNLVLAFESRLNDLI